MRHLIWFWIAAWAVYTPHAHTRADDAHSTRALPLSEGAEAADDPAVVAIVRADAPTTLRCTGALITPQIVLTAAHCGVQADPSAFAIWEGVAFGDGGALTPILAAWAHPSFRGDATADLALLLIAAPRPSPPLALHDAAPPLGASLRLVGFGATAGGADDAGRKRTGAAQVVAVEAASVTLGAAPSLPCLGDSGGPALLATPSGEQVAAVVSRGDADCASYSKLTRIDAHIADFITPMLAALAPGAASDGAPCLYDAQCAQGRCLASLDEPTLRFCGRPCALACAPPLTCVAGWCQHLPPSPGALGSACQSDAACARGQCLGGQCAQRCGGASGACPPSYACEHAGGVDFFCALPPPSGGGCAITTPRRALGRGAGAAVALAACALCLCLTLARQHSRPHLRTHR